MKYLLLMFIMALTLPGFAQEDDDAVIDKLQEMKQKQHEKMQQIMLKRTREEADAATNVPPEIQKLGYKEINLKALSDERVIKHLKSMFEKSPLITMKKTEVRGIIMDKAKGSFFEGYFQDHPKVVDCIASIMMSREAMPQAISIFLRKGDLMLYFIIWILFMIMSWVLKKILLNEGSGRLKRNLIGLLVSITMTGLSLFSFYKIFEKELSPTASIILEHWENRHS